VSKYLRLLYGTVSAVKVYSVEWDEKMIINSEHILVWKDVVMTYFNILP
jgi:hypothetical protein